MNYQIELRENIQDYNMTDKFFEYFKKGGSIHIKKENRGKFTEYCGGKVTSECIAKGKNSKSATIGKRATFADNARKWSHEKGGNVHNPFHTVSVLDGTKNIDQKTLKLKKYQTGGTMDKYFAKYESLKQEDIDKWKNSNPLSITNSVYLPDYGVASATSELTAEETPTESKEFNITYVDYDKPTTSTTNKKMPEPGKYKGLEAFNKAFDEVISEDKDAAKYRNFLTRIAEKESKFDNYIQNTAGAPAYGYFQFMQDGKKYNNISAYAGTDIETFRNDPKLQIKAAIKLAKDFERGFSAKDLEAAKSKGYNMDGLLAGAWLGGVGGVRRYLYGMGDASDKHWSKSGAGTTVGTRIKEFSA